MFGVHARIDGPRHLQPVRRRKLRNPGRPLLRHAGFQDVLKGAPGRCLRLSGRASVRLRRGDFVKLRPPAICVRQRIDLAHVPTSSRAASLSVNSSRESVCASVTGVKAISVYRRNRCSLRARRRIRSRAIHWLAKRICLVTISQEYLRQNRHTGSRGKAPGGDRADISGECGKLKGPAPRSEMRPRRQNRLPILVAGKIVDPW
jgi:hypothetical protein